MKNLTRLISITLCAVFLLSSCSKMGSLSVTKRHYTGGYYVDFGGHKPSTTPAEKQSLPSAEKQTATTMNAVPADLAAVNHNKETAPAITATPEVKSAIS